MAKKEIIELMDLKGWTQAQLARELDVSEGAISLWLSGQRPVTGPARILMRLWLKMERDEAKKQLA